MTREEALSAIQVALDGVLAAKGSPPAALSADTALVGGGLGIDSLDLAGLVVDLQTSTGLDPFAAGFVNFRTAGELADLFAGAAA